MLSTRAVCSRCVTRAILASPQQLSKAATFASLADAATSTSQPAPTAQAEQRARRRDALRNRRWEKPLSSEESALALFNHVVQGEDAPQVDAPSSLGMVELASKLKGLREKDESADQKLKVFIQDIWPHISAIPGQLPKQLHHSTLQFISETCIGLADTCQPGQNLAIAKIYTRLGIIRTEDLNRLVLNLCYTLSSKNMSLNRRKHTLYELINLWKHVSQMRRASARGRPELAFILPSEQEILRTVDKQSSSTEVMHPLTQTLAAMFPQYYANAQKLVPGLLASAAIFADPEISHPQVRKQAAHLLRLFAAAVHAHEDDHGCIESAFAEKSSFPRAKLSEMQAYVDSQWSRVLEMLSEDAPWRIRPEDSKGDDPETTRKFTSIHRQLRTAYLARNHGAIAYLWNDFAAYIQKQSQAVDQLHENPEFLDFWVFVWCAVRRPNRLQETLDLINKVGLEPTVRTYTSMMHGWKMCKEAHKIEALWRHLVKSEAELDTVIWTERISSLIEAGKPQQGIQALGEMQASWKAAHAKNPETTAPRPQIEVINAVVKGLLLMDRQAAHEVLSWASQEGIDPNIRTYNILLRETFKRNDVKGVQNLLKFMNDQGVEPDAATFTIMLEEVLGSMTGASAEELVEAVHQIFDDIQKAGLKPNPETYGKMLYAVASQPRSHLAMEAVQSHMVARGFSITPHMVTILIERALDRPQPDINAIQELLQKHNLSGVSKGDQTLWERVMSAYAITGHTTEAMRVFDDLAAASRPVTSLPCVLELLRALLHVKDHETAQRVVDDVLRHKALSVERGDSRYWRHHFWHLARQHGLMKGKEVPSSDSVL